MGETGSRSVAGVAGRFLVAGAVNTLVTAALCGLLALWIDQRIAYTVAFVLGIALSTLLAGRYVFRTRLTLGRTVGYVVLYLGVYLVGLSVTTATMRVGCPAWAAGLVVFVTAPLGFLGGTLIFGDREDGEFSAPGMAPHRPEG